MEKVSDFQKSTREGAFLPSKNINFCAHWRGAIDGAGAQAV